jgi:phosphoserine aminotransferase
MKQMKMLIMNIGHQNIMFMRHVTHSISNSLHNKCMNLLHLPEKYYISILDGDAGTCVLEQG